MTGLHATARHPEGEGAMLVPGLVLVLAGPWFGVWMLKGNLSASLVFDTIPLTDPFLIVQAMVAGHWPYAKALTGGAIMLAFYLFVGGRVRIDLRHGRAGMSHQHLRGGLRHAAHGAQAHE